jgi:hypothetical protein
MSQFRIKNIDQATPDEWVYKLNDGASIVGDDIDARDPNELADAIYDTQVLLLKTSVLPAGAILKAASGIAERITLLETIAGNSTLQDIYANGNTISLTSGKPLIFGTREEFRLDDAGNLSFKPITMKVRGAGLTTLDITNISLTTNLGDLLVGAISPGSKLTLKAENYLYLKDVFLTNPITLSEPGNVSLGTTSQSLVGAINELKSSSFSTTLQSVYAQSTPPKLITNITQGSVIIEDPNPLSNADALRVTGILNVTRKAKLGSLKVGINTTIEDTTGITTSDPITTSNQVSTPYVTSGINDLILQDKRISFPLSDNSVSDLSTTRKSIIGAINELKTDILTVGASTTLFNNQHDSSTGFHKIITTQAEIGNNAAKRFTIKNQSGVDTYTINGFGDIVANSASIGGLSVVTLLNSLIAHIANDGTAHSAFAAHLVDPNPHNTVKQILGLAGNVSLASTDASINISTAGNTIDLKFNNTINMQQTYNNLVTKELSLPTASGLGFRDTTSSNLLMMIRSTDIMLQKDLNLEYSLAKVRALADLTVQAQTQLSLISIADNIVIKTTDTSKKVTIQDVDFNETGAATLPISLGLSILGAFKTLNDDTEITLNNHFNFDIDYTAPFILDSSERIWPLIPDLHPANEFISQVDFFWANKGPIYLPKQTVATATSGLFYKSGTRNLKGSSAVSMPLSFMKGLKIYPMKLGSVDINIDSIAAIANLNKLILGKDLIGITNGSAVNTSIGQFKVETLGTDPTDLKIDKTRNNIIGTINDYAYMTFGASATYLKAGVWGEYASTYITISGAIAQDLVTPILTLTPHSALGESVAVSFFAKNSPTAWADFSASTDSSIAAANLADAINRTTFNTSSVATNGHGCIATASGPVIKLRWYKPGRSGSLITLSSGSANLSAGLMTGGTSVVRVYNMEYSDSTMTVSQSTMPSSDIYFSAANISAKEKASQYVLSASEALATTRYAPFYEKKEIGSIEGVSGNTLRLKIKD